MPYKYFINPRFEKDIKAFKKDAPTKALVLKIMSEITENPEIYESYSGPMSDYRKAKFKSPSGVSYRIGFRIYNCCAFENPNDCPSDMDIEGACNGIVQFDFVKTRQECDSHYRKDIGYFKQSPLDLDIK